MDIIMFSSYLAFVRERARDADKKKKWKAVTEGTLAGYILRDIINLEVVIAFFP